MFHFLCILELIVQYLHFWICSSVLYTYGNINRKTHNYLCNFAVSLCKLWSVKCVIIDCPRLGLSSGVIESRIQNFIVCSRHFCQTPDFNHAGYRLLRNIIDIEKYRKVRKRIKDRESQV